MEKQEEHDEDKKIINIEENEGEIFSHKIHHEQKKERGQLILTSISSWEKYIVCFC